MRGSGRSIFLPLLHRLFQILVRRCLDPLRSLFGPRATDPEMHVIATATSATTSAAGTDGAESAAHDERRRRGPLRLIVWLLPAAPTFAPRTT
jgi:hypothetical protein